MRRHDAVLVEDCAQAHGTTYRSVPIGSFGSADCFGFYPTKSTTTGEGGMVVADEGAARCRSFIDHGRAPDGGHERVGHGFRVTDIRAAVERVQLGRLDGFVAVGDAAVLVLGIAYRAGDETRKSPTRPVVSELDALGASMWAADPAVDVVGAPNLPAAPCSMTEVTATADRQTPLSS
ncbi:hypothetical protein BRC76_05485 [Halobacteriales archaeon QH_8_67_36]|nr:MAG: hypothetical protein BRC76_05485 [Halobacteriales archaeon QH_8_67_36]